MTVARSIPLQAVRDALMFAIVRQKATGARVSRFAAYTAIQPLAGVTCASPAYRRNTPQRSLESAHLHGMWRGDLDRLVQRQRLEHGLPEVRRIWGAGLRALQAECKGFSLP